MQPDQSAERVAEIARGFESAILEAASSQLAKDMAGHIGDQIHGVLRRQCMLMPTISLAAAAGVLAARQVLEETILFARKSMDGDADDEAAIEAALRTLFDQEASQVKVGEGERG